MTRRGKKHNGWKWGRGAVRQKGTTWYIRYSRHNKRHEEKTTAASRKEAEEKLRQRLHALDEGTFDPDTRHVRVADLYENLVRDYRLNGRRVQDLEKRWNHLEPAFGQDVARTVGTARIRDYMDRRLAKGAQPATVQREIACLRRMFRLGFAERKVTQLPHFPSLHVENARQGFVERGDLERLREELPPHLRPLLTVAYWTGWRRGELLGMEWRQVNLETGEIRLDPGTTKNKQGRVAYLPQEALHTLTAWRHHTRELEREQQRMIPHVFHDQGEPIRDFYAAWRSACTRAGVPGLLFHDLRRSSVRNYVKAGVPERVAMAVSGHKTRAIFDRYHIVADGDLQDAAQRVAAVKTGEELGKIAVLGKISRGE